MGRVWWPLAPPGHQAETGGWDIIRDMGAPVIMSTWGDGDPNRGMVTIGTK